MTKNNPLKKIALGMLVAIGLSVGTPSARADGWCAVFCGANYMLEQSQCATAFDILLASCAFQAANGGGSDAMQQCVGSATDFMQSCQAIAGAEYYRCQNVCY